MVAPNLSIDVEPTDGTAAQYLRLAPRREGEPHTGQLSLVIPIRNNEAGPVNVTQVVVSFSGGPAVNPVTLTPNMQIPPGDRRAAFFETANNVILPIPAPNQVTIGVTCNGFADPASRTLPLTRYFAPVAGDAYVFFARAADLLTGEFWLGSSASHASGSGSQLFAYDMFVVAFDSSTNQWTGELPGPAGGRNIHSRTYGKPIYAMADGVITGLSNAFDDNARGGGPRPGTPVEGNHFWIQHATDVVLYAHLQADTMDASLLSVGAAVAEGQFLGRAGNSGNSSGPHAHIHIMMGNAPWGGPLRPLPFRNALVVDRAQVTPPPSIVPWARMEADGPPPVVALILPDQEPDSGGRDFRDRSFVARIREAIRLIARILKIPIGPDPVP